MRFLTALTRLRWAVQTAAGSALPNIPLVVLSLVLAIALWVVVTNEENPSVRREVPFTVRVEDVNVPRSMIVTDHSPQAVRVVLTGPRSQVNSIRPEDLVARVDLANANPGGSTGASAITFTANVQVSVRQPRVAADAEPPTVEMTLEPLVRRTVPVELRRVDTLPVGFELTDQLVPQPSQAVVSGSAENVAAVETLVADVKLSGLTTSVTQTLALAPQDSAGHAIGGVTSEPAVATVSVKLRQALFTRSLLVNPQIRGRPAPGYRVVSIKTDPQTLSVLGNLDALNQVAGLSTQDIDVEGASSDVIRTVGVQLPQGVSLAGAQSTVVVSVTVQAQRGPGSLAVVPRIVGLSADVNAVLETPTVVVNLTGPVPLLLRLTPADLTVSLDMTGLGPGGYRIEPKVTAPGGIQVDGVVPDHVGAIITRAGPR